jgi:hypothetical protein
VNTTEPIGVAGRLIRDEQGRDEHNRARAAGLAGRAVSRRTGDAYQARVAESAVTPIRFRFTTE